MCDYSAQGVKTRAAVKADLLTTASISSHTTGFVGINDDSTAVCLRPGTELAFDSPVRARPDNNGIINALVNGSNKLLGPVPPDQKVATFMQVNQGMEQKHHDALIFLDGSVVLLHHLEHGQTAEVLSLPADPSTLDGQERQAAEVAQRREAYA